MIALLGERKKTCSFTSSSTTRVASYRILKRNALLLELVPNLTDDTAAGYGASDWQ